MAGLGHCGAEGSIAGRLLVTGHRPKRMVVYAREPTLAERHLAEACAVEPSVALETSITISRSPALH